MSSEPARDGDPGDDPVARNRATPRRQVPGRRPVGVDVTNQLRRITGAVLLVATLVLLAVLVIERVT